MYGFSVLRIDHGIALAVPALETIIRFHDRLKRRGPVFLRFHVLDVEIASRTVHRHVVVTVFGDAAVAGIFVKGKPAGGLADNSAIPPRVGNIIDPGGGCVGPGDDVFALVVGKVTVFHYAPAGNWVDGGCYCSIARQFLATDQFLGRKR